MLPTDAPATADGLRWTIAVDLAQGGPDYTAVAVLETQTFPGAGRPANGHGLRPEHRVVALERWRDARPARVPERVAAIVQRLRSRQAERDLERHGRAPVTRPDISLLVDRTGVGPYGLDPLRQAGFGPIGILIHGGDATTRDALGFRVPKRDLAGAVAVTLQARRLKVLEALPLAETLRVELASFKPKISLATGHDSYGADGPWREGRHDDLVLATAMGVWYGERDGGTIELNPPAIAVAMSRLMADR